MKTVVTGASGMLGSAVVRELKARREKDYQAWARTKRVAYTQLDLTDSDRVRKTLMEFRPELIIHTAALTDADYCEHNSQTSRQLNAFVPGDLAVIAKELEARFVHVSTDAVYRDDLPGKRREEDALGPHSEYARHKLEGEGRVLAVYPEALVVRTTMFGWTLKTAPRPKFAEQILAALYNRRQKTLFYDAWFSPLYVGTLAECLLDLGELDVEGVINVGARFPVNKYYFGQCLGEMFGLDTRFLVKGSIDDAESKGAGCKNVGLATVQFSKHLGPPPRVEEELEVLYREAFDGTAEKIRGRKTYP